MPPALLEAPGIAKRQLRRVEVRATPEEGDGTFVALVADYTVEAYSIGWGWSEMILPGTFADSISENAVIPVNWQHDWRGGPIGDAAPTETDKGLFVKGRLYLAVDPLVERIYLAMQAGAVKEWSIGFIALTIASDAEMPYTDIISRGDLVEASACYRGANPGTATLDLRSQPVAELEGDESTREREVIRLRTAFGEPPRVRAAIPYKKTDTSTAAWDGPGQEANLSNDDGADVYRDAFAWVDPDKDADTKAAYSFVHHFVSDAGVVGDASTVACSSAIGVLNGGRGDNTDAAWWGDREAIYAHLAHHLTDAGLTAPDLADLDSEGKPKTDAKPAEHLELRVALRAMKVRRRHQQMRARLVQLKLRADDDEPSAGDLASALDEVIDQIQDALDDGDTAAAAALALAADSTSDDLLEALGATDVPDDGDDLDALLAALIGDDDTPTGPGDGDWRAEDETALRSALGTPTGWALYREHVFAASKPPQSPPGQPSP